MPNKKREKKWKVYNKYPSEFADIFPEFHPIIVQLLYNRGINSQEMVDEFLHPDYSQDLHDPFLFRDMEKAVKRIWRAVDLKERVVVYGDYDADGVCSAALLMSFFQAVGLTPEIYIPHRELEGYGLNMAAVDNFIAQGVDLVITVDCGTTNYEEINKLQSAGIDVIVIDHHHVEKEPDSFAFLNCANPNDNYPFAKLAAVGMVFKTVQGLLQSAWQDKREIPLRPGQEKWWLDLVAIATVTDMMPLRGENHTLVKYGLIVLNKTRRIGLQSLFAAAGLELGKVDTWQIGFVIGPRLNAAGRLDHANTAYALLMSESKAEADQHALSLQEANVQRQSLTDKFVRQAKEMAKPQVEAGDKLIVVFNPEWELGVVGLVASRLTEEFGRPSLAITISQGKIKGSGRSISAFDIMSALEKQSDHLEKFGGHKQACGFTIASQAEMENFIQGMKMEADQITADDLQPILTIDAEVKLSDIDFNLLSEIDKFAPFGQGNPQPRFLTRGLQVIGVDFAGSDNQHIRLMVGDENGIIRKTIGFGLGEKWGDLQMGDRVDVVYEVSINEWNGNRELQLKIIDIKRNEQ